MSRGFIGVRSKIWCPSKILYLQLIILQQVGRIGKFSVYR